MKIAIVGREKFTLNYSNYVKRLGHTPLQTLNPEDTIHCDALLLPGGGDIAPTFWGEENCGCGKPDQELDTLQFKAFEEALRRKLPILGICKGMQLINVALGGTLCQHMPNAAFHSAPGKDLYHLTRIPPASPLRSLYGETALVNSAHHQCIKKMGRKLLPIQFCAEDSCIEGICHETLPILGVQWHPERLDTTRTSVSGEALLTFFLARKSPTALPGQYKASPPAHSDKQDA